MDAFSELLRRLGLDLTSLSNVLARVLNASIVRDGRRVTLTLAAGATEASARHGLGRSYQAALLEHADDALTGFHVLPPGGDSSTLVTVAVRAAPSSPVTLSLWVY